MVDFGLCLLGLLSVGSCNIQKDEELFSPSPSLRQTFASSRSPVLTLQSGVRGIPKLLARLWALT